MTILELAKTLNIQENTKLTFTDPLRTGYPTPFAAHYILYENGNLSLVDFDWINAHLDSNTMPHFKPLNIEISE